MVIWHDQLLKQIFIDLKIFFWKSKSSTSIYDSVSLYFPLFMLIVFLPYISLACLNCQDWVIYERGIFYECNSHLLLPIGVTFFYWLYLPPHLSIWTPFTLNVLYMYCELLFNAYCVEQFLVFQSCWCRSIQVYMQSCITQK